MRAVVQRVSSASVTIDHAITAQIHRGLLVLLGIQQTDTPADVEWLATKIANLRIFSDDEGKMNLSLLDLNQPQSEIALDPAATNPHANALVVSQFTLIASTRKGNRPSFNDAARPPEAIPLYEAFLTQLGNLLGRSVAHGTFGAMMQVALINDGPVTIVLDSKLRE
jgi:D-tyrosyl-tRNA(Tyr) deacylase